MSIVVPKNRDEDSLSIVIQGPTELNGKPVAKFSAMSARKHFPKAEIIISCWSGDKTEGLEKVADKLVKSDDPGPQFHSGGVLNVNRQIVSSRSGVSLATRPYVLKFRSDLIFCNKRIWAAYLDQKTKFRMCRNYDPILITNLTTVNHRRHPRYFSLCDWIYLGPMVRVSEIFAAPLFPNDYLNYTSGRGDILRYNAEQWIAINYLKKHGLTVCDGHNGYLTGCDIEKDHFDFVGSQFVMASWFRLGLATQKHRISSFDLRIMYTQREWDAEFLGRRTLLDAERFAVTLAYHPLVRNTAKLLKRVPFV